MRSKFLKKSLAVLVAATMAFSALPMFAGAASEEGTVSAVKSSTYSHANQAAITATPSGNAVTVTETGELVAYKNASNRTEKWFGLVLSFDGINEITSASCATGYTVNPEDFGASAVAAGANDGELVVWLSAEALAEPKTLTFTINDSTIIPVTFTFVPKKVDPKPETPTDDDTTATVAPTKPGIPVDVAPNAPITVAPVIKGIDPAVAETLTLNVTEAKKEEGAGKTAFEAAAANGAVLGFYEIKLTKPDGSPYVLGEGETLEMTFELGKEYANQKMVIRHYNSETGKHIKDYEVTADENGKVTIEVTELSFFAVQKAAAKSTNPKTGDSTQIFVLLSVLAVAGASVVVLRKRQLAK